LEKHLLLFKPQPSYKDCYVYKAFIKYRLACRKAKSVFRLKQIGYKKAAAEGKEKLKILLEKSSEQMELA
jgi:hypothetical protein